jgi:hypothetical protein
MPELSPYATVKPLFGSLASWIADEETKQRLAAYQVYENIYWGVPQTFKLMARGEENSPIYVPCARVIVETMNRFVAPNAKIIPDPQFGTPNDRDLAHQVVVDLMRRERFISRFNSNRRFGLIRGDWMFHLFADPLRAPGSKLSIETVDPSTVFPIYNPLNIDELIGYHVADETVNPKDASKAAIRRTTYMKQTGTGGPSPILVTDGYYEVDAWGGPGMKEEEAKLIQAAAPDQVLPSPIDQLPIYHIPNFVEPGRVFGSSEFRGLERIFAAVNQSISDEELALAMEGLGCYATDAGTPVDDDGNEEPWNLGPGRVVELPEGKQMLRVNGVGHVTPYQDHLAYLHEQIDQVFGMGAIAKGRVDVATAESGVALFLELAPLLAHAEEKDQVVTDVLTNMWFDVPKWLVAYEGSALNSLVDVTRYIPAYGDKVPQNNSAKVEELVSLATLPGVLSATYIRERLRKLGYDDMPDEATIAAQVSADTASQQDAFGARVDGEVQGALEDGATEGADTSAFA